MFQGKVLVVDDDEFFRSVHAECLKGGGYEVVLAASGREALDVVESGEVDIVVTDLFMPDIDGQEVLERTKQHDALIDVIVVTGHGTIESAITAMKSGAVDYIRKPVNQEELLLSVARCIEQKELVRENQDLRRSLKLFEVSKTITSCLEIEKLYDLTLDAMMQEVPSCAGLCLFYNEKRDVLNVRSNRQILPESAEKIAAYFKETYDKDSFPGVKVFLIDLKDSPIKNFDSMEEINSIVVAPVRREKLIIGFLLMMSRLCKDKYDNVDIKNAAFISEQATLAFENAGKYVEAKKVAYMDSLTNLYNPKFLDVAIDRELKRSERSMSPFSVLFMDLDNFKRINDEYGHLVGSKILIEVSQLILECVREIDTVIRYGGDEYTIVLVDSDTDIASTVAERIRESIEMKVFMQDEALSVHITTSIGIASCPLHAQDKKSLLEMADKAMYHGKNKTKNSVYIASDILD
ncbi:MAG: diguanylate cyclase [Proteobacteria bacterium]|nr:diguanylate cyclase [Pseudomonadota bacterium]